MEAKEIEEKAVEEYPLNANNIIAKCICNEQRFAFYKGAEWAQEESNLRDIRLDTIQCCEEYLAKFGTLDGVYEHYFADITEK